jgi:transposase
LSRRSPHVVVLSEADRRLLEARARAYTAPHAQVVRAKIVLLAADGALNTAIAERLDVHVDVVSKWRQRFAAEGLAGLVDRKRSGRPPVFAAEVVAEVKAMACEPPRQRQVPLSRWSSSELARQAVEQGCVQAVSASTVRRWLAKDAIKPWRYRSWIFPRDPQFAVKAGRVLDLYSRIWDGQELGEDDYVISADEKSQLQALSRCHPELPPGPGRQRRVEFEYDRHGTLAYLAGYDVHRAHLIGTIAPTTGIVPFSELVDKVMRTEPYASARRVFWVVDNGSSHNGARSVARMQAAWPTARLVHLPVHASWLNQVEIVFSVVQRKVVKPADFTDLDDLGRQLTAFEPRYNATARPFDWRFTRTDLNDLIRRLDSHRPACPDDAGPGETLTHGHPTSLDQEQPRTAALTTSA